MSDETSTTIDLLNGLLGAYYTALAQHQTHVTVLHSWGITGLAQAMEERIADEPVTIATMMRRLLDLGGRPDFAFGDLNLGTSVREVLDNDLEIQLLARPGLNAAAETAAAEHDATTRVLIEGILADEEQHLAWLQGEIDLLERLGEPLYLANRLGSSPTPD